MSLSSTIRPPLADAIPSSPSTKLVTTGGIVPIANNGRVVNQGILSPQKRSSVAIKTVAAAMMVDKENIADLHNMVHHSTDRHDLIAKSNAKNIIKTVPSSSSGVSCSTSSCVQLRAQLAMMERQYSDTILRMERLEGKYRLCWQAANDCKDHVSRADYNVLRKQNALLLATHVGKTVLSVAPAWQNRDACTRCQLTRSHDAAKFGITRRRHHCRSCGHSLCSSCIGNQEMPLPHLGFFKPVRVCHTCTSALALAHAANATTTVATATSASTSSAAAAAAVRRRSSISGIGVLPPAMAPSSSSSSVRAPSVVSTMTVISSPSAPACVLPTPLPTPGTTTTVHASSADSWTVRPPSVPSSPSTANHHHDHIHVPLPMIPSSDDESKIPMAPSLDDVPAAAFVPPTPPPLDDTYLAASSSATVIYHGTTTNSGATIDSNVPLSSSLTSSSIEAARAGLRRRASTSSVPITSAADKVADAAQVRDQILAAIRSRASTSTTAAASSSSSDSVVATSSSSSSSSDCPRTPLRSGKARSSSFSGASPKDMLSMLQAQVRARRIGITRGSDDTTAVSTNSILPRCVTPVQRRCPPTPTSHNVALRTSMISDTVAQMLDCSPGVPLKPQADEWTD